MCRFRHIDTYSTSVQNVPEWRCSNLLKSITDALLHLTWPLIVICFNQKLACVVGHDTNEGFFVCFVFSLTSFTIVESLSTQIMRFAWPEPCLIFSCVHSHTHELTQTWTKKCTQNRLHFWQCLRIIRLMFRKWLDCNNLTIITADEHTLTVLFIP